MPSHRSSCCRRPLACPLCSPRAEQSFTFLPAEELPRHIERHGIQEATQWICKQASSSSSSSSSAQAAPVCASESASSDAVRLQSDLSTARSQLSRCEEALASSRLRGDKQSQRIAFMQKVRTADHCSDMIGRCGHHSFALTARACVGLVQRHADLVAVANKLVDEREVYRTRMAALNRLRERLARERDESAMEMGAGQPRRAAGESASQAAAGAGAGHRVCKVFMRTGRCSFGDQCRFLHPAEPHES